MSNNGKRPTVTRKEIQSFIDDFQMQAQEAAGELEKADQALGDWKLAQLESQKAEAAAKGGTLPRAPVFILENTEERQHFEYTRARAVGKLADIRKRIKMLQKAKKLTPQ